MMTSEASLMGSLDYINEWQLHFPYSFQIWSYLISQYQWLDANSRKYKWNRWGYSPRLIRTRCHCTVHKDRSDLQTKLPSHTHYMKVCSLYPYHIASFLLHIRLCFAYSVPDIIGSLCSCHLSSIVYSYYRCLLSSYSGESRSSWAFQTS